MADQPDDQYDLFISYAEADRAWVEGYLLDGLAQAGVRIHSETTFHLGQPRLNEFEHAVKQSKRVLLVLSPDYFGDPMNAFVDLLAAVHGLDQSTWPAVPLVLKRVELPLRLKALVSLDATEPAGWPAVIQKLCEELKRPVPALPSKPPCPYPGMRPFTEEESTVFFGRRQEVDDLLQCLRLHSFLAVIGRSGSGKSSLVFAGLVPALRKSTLFGVGDWLVRSMRPGETPHDTFLSLVPSDGVEPTAAATKLLADAQATHLLLVIDQFEEVFTLAIGSGQARAFQESLLRWINLPECLIVLTVRADFYQDLMTCPLWPQVQSHRYEVLSLGRDGLCEAIVLPAGRAQVYVEQSLVERLLNDAAAEPGMLPLVQETMVLLWEKLQRRFLPVNAYEDIDRSDRTGLQVAMAIRADAVMRDLLSDAHRVVARRIFLRLIQFGEGRLDMRRQQSRSQLRSQGDDPAVFDQTLDHLINARLLVAGESEHKDPPVDLAHERLITGWPTLQQYLRERREAEQKRRRLEDKAQEWIRLGSSSGGLLDSVQLLEAEQWLASLDAAELGRSDDLAALVQVSQAAIERDEREKEAARQRELAQAQALVAQQQRVAKEQSLRVRIAVTLGLVALVAAVVAFFFMRQARTQARIAISRQLIAQAFERLKGNELDLALLLSVEAYRANDSFESRNALLTSLQHKPYLTAFLHGHFRSVTSVAFGPDGKMLASGGEDGTIVVWDMATLRPIHNLHTGAMDLELAETMKLPGVVSIAFGGEGKTLAVVSYGTWSEPLSSTPSRSKSTIILWDLTTHPATRKHRTDYDGWVYSMAVSRDGKRLVTGHENGAVRVWDVENRQPPDELSRGTSSNIHLLTFSPDGKTLASGSREQSWEGSGQSTIILCAPCKGASTIGVKHLSIPIIHPR